MDAELLRDRLRLRDEFTVVGTGHIRETRAEHLHIWPNKRVGQVVDMVTDDHQVADTEGLVDPACSVGDEEILDTEELHHTHREGHLLHRIAFVVVEAPLHT